MKVYVLRNFVSSDSGRVIRAKAGDTIDISSPTTAKELMSMGLVTLEASAKPAKKKGKKETLNV